jgi:hypothetical protein
MPCTAFELKPVSPLCLDLTVWTLRRRSHNIVDRWDGTTYRRVLPLPAGSVEVAVTGEPARPIDPGVRIHHAHLDAAAVLTRSHRCLETRHEESRINFPEQTPSTKE